MAQQWTLFSFGLTRSNVSKAKRHWVAGEEREDDDRPETEEREDDREDHEDNRPETEEHEDDREDRENDRPETKTELELRQPDTGSNGQTTSDRQRIEVVASRCPELSDDLGRITISQACKLSDGDKQWLLKNCCCPSLDFKFPIKVEYEKSQSYSSMHG